MPKRTVKITKGNNNKKGRGIVWMLSWSADDVYFWANWGLAGSLIFGVALTIAVIVSGNIKEAALKRELAASSERTAGLEKEAADARLELARINPINLPIKSMIAEVYIVIRSDDFREPFFPATMGGDFAISDRDGVLIALRCKNRDCMPTFLTDPITKATLQKANALTVSMTFSWPAGTPFAFRYWVDRNNASLAELDKRVIGAMFDVPEISNNSEIVSGVCVVTINGTLQRRFEIPKMTLAGTVTCLPINQ